MLRLWVKNGALEEADCLTGRRRVKDIPPWQECFAGAWNPGVKYLWQSTIKIVKKYTKLEYKHIAPSAIVLYNKYKCKV